MFKVIPFLVLVTICQFEFAQATVDYPELVYKQNVRAQHDAVFNQQVLLSHEDVHAALLVLQANQKDYVDRPTTVDQLIDFSSPSPIRCTGPALQKCRAFVDSFVGIGENLQPYLQQALNKQMAFCKQALLTEVSNRLDRVGSTEKQLAEMFRRVFFNNQDLGRNYLGRVQMLADFVAQYYRFSDQFECNEDGANEYLDGLIGVSIGQLSQACFKIERQLRPVAKLLTVVIVLSVDEMNQLNPNLIDWLGWRVACSVFISGKIPEAPDVAQLLKHRTIIENTFLGRKLESEHWSHLDEWRRLKRLVYDPNPVESPPAGLVLRTLNRIEFIQTLGDLRHAKLLATNIEKQLIGLTSVTSSNCPVFQQNYKYLNQRHIREPIVLAYLAHYFNIQLELCLESFSQSIKKHAEENFDEFDWLMRDLVMVTEGWRRGNFPNSSEMLAKSIRSYAGLGNELREDRIQNKLNYIKMLCDYVTKTFADRFEYFESLDESSRSRLDRDSLVWMYGTELCRVYLATLEGQQDSDNMPPPPPRSDAGGSGPSSSRDEAGPSQRDEAGPSQRDEAGPSQRDEAGTLQTDEFEQYFSDLASLLQPSDAGPSITEQAGPSGTKEPEEIIEISSSDSDISF